MSDLVVLVVMLTLKIWRSWYEREVFRGLTKEKPFICHNDYRTVGNSGDVDDEVCGGLIAEQASKSISKGRQ